MLPAVDFDHAEDVSGFVRARFSTLFPGAPEAWLQRVFSDVEAFFKGRQPGYAAIDLRYHDLRHTLMATACMAVLLEGQHSVHGDQHLSARDFELAIAGVLLHDSGYLKLKSDTQGTGAKYTFCHILRSCAFAASYLPEVGTTDIEIENVLVAINCTGPNSQIGRLNFRDSASRVVGCALATADYIAQMSDPRYPDKLGELFRELSESDEFANVPVERRVFKTEADLLRGTPGFWKNFVKPKLTSDFQSVYRFLARPVQSDKNDYLSAIEANFSKIEARIAALDAAG